MNHICPICPTCLERLDLTLDTLCRIHPDATLRAENRNWPCTHHGKPLPAANRAQRRANARAMGRNYGRP